MRGCGWVDMIQYLHQAAGAQLTGDLMMAVLKESHEHRELHAVVAYLHDAGLHVGEHEDSLDWLVAVCHNWTERDDPWFVDFFVEMGVDVCMPNHSGRTPLQAAWFQLELSMLESTAGIYAVSKIIAALCRAERRRCGNPKTARLIFENH